jgi:hypothetical protein
MNLYGQLADSALSQRLQRISVPPYSPETTQIANTGLLGNLSVQIIYTGASEENFAETYQRLLAATQPSVKLSALKRDKFTRQDREARIHASLAALNAAPPTHLTIGQWKEVVEEVEDEE